ncbi:hypothetical protein GCM10009828_002790 [Actinoplanes couchii]|uniref:Uncharacterized protein n=2 Tax=Actinoplanes couchii TaxID=403638 RepID=A0ABQ3XMS5_9ACTN|nr:hypothetical protein Aco03nite_082110 [Actinoplanes couchii]
MLERVAVETGAYETRVLGMVRWPRSEGELLEFRIRDAAGGPPPPPPANPGNTFVPAFTLPAMAIGEPLIVNAPVSGRLLRGARDAMDLYHRWWDVKPVEIAPASTAGPTAAASGVGLFFTAGVDSHYSLLKDLRRADAPGHREITHLVFANVHEDDGPDHERLVTRLTEVAQETGKQLLIVETNLRALTEEVVGWNEYHGAALAAVALALEGVLGTCLLAAGEDYGHLPPWGSHPLLDPLWSTEGLALVHDGVEAARVEKISQYLVHSALALRTLTVCGRTQPGLNCGACDQCVSTMIALEIGGGLGECATLPHDLDTELVRQTRLRGWSQSDSWRELANQLATVDRPDLSAAVAEALAGADGGTAWKPMFQRTAR